MSSTLPAEAEIEIGIEEKRAALQFALGSECLSRSERLKSLLSYLCEAEFANEHHRLTEYDIAVSALGRRPDFSPIEDSTVRSRTYELRQKLEKLYAHEAPLYPIRIDIPKGNYRPKFHRVRATRFPQDRLVTAPEPALAPQIPIRREKSGSSFLGKGWAFLAGAALTILLFLLVSSIRGHVKPSVEEGGRRDGPGSPEVRELWAPFLSTTRPLLVTFETRLFVEVGPLVVRDPTIESMYDIESSRAIMQVKQLVKAPQVYEARRYADFSVANALFSISELLALQGVSARAERSADLTDDEVHADNLILLGKPGAYNGIRMMLPKSPNFAFQSNIALMNLHPLAGEQSIYTKQRDPAASGGLTREYGVILMTRGAEKSQHILYIESAESDLFWPLGVYLTQPDHVKELTSHLRLPSGKLPECYEVVVKAEFRGRGPTNVTYVTHRVLGDPDK
jgi:hypothetical protein